MDRRTFVDLTLATTANSLLSRIAFAQTAPKTKCRTDCRRSDRHEYPDI